MQSRTELLEEAENTRHYRVGPAQDIDPKKNRTDLGPVLRLRGALSEAENAL